MVKFFGFTRLESGNRAGLALLSMLAPFKTCGLVLSPDCLLRSPDSSITGGGGLRRKEEKHHKIVKNNPEN